MMASSRGARDETIDAGDDCIESTGAIDAAAFDFLTPFVQRRQAGWNPASHWVYHVPEGTPDDPHCPWRRANRPITDQTHIEAEERFMRSILEEDGSDKAAAAERLLTRGVSVDSLVGLTRAHNLWDWQTYDVVQSLVKAATEKSRCRFADLPEVRPFTGTATVFMSHTWSGRWGDLVAAAAAGARGSRIVWIDAFAVRQWPGNAADLNFRAVVEKCTAVIVAAPPTGGPDSSRIFRGYTYTSDHEAFLRDERYEDGRKAVPFGRLWCIVEMDAAKQAGVPIIIKTAKVVPGASVP